MLSLPPLSLYVHFPWCVRKCPYCDFNSYTLNGELAEETYLRRLERDIETQSAEVVFTAIYPNAAVRSACAHQHR